MKRFDRYIIVSQCLIAFLLLFSNPLFAQRSLKYENVVKKAEASLNKIEAFGLYSDYLSLNPASDRANLYYKLAEYSSTIMKELDPLTDYSKIKELYLKSTDYYQLCEHYIDDDNARKDQNFFNMVRSSQKRMSAADIITYIILKRETDSIYFSNASTVSEAFTSLVKAYYNCMDIYKTICRNNRNLNDIYINMESNRGLLDSMIDSYDSIFFFKDKLSNKLPNLSFMYKRLEYFKLDGFTPANFKIAAEIWDYKSWANEQKNYYDKNVLPLLQSSSEILKQLDSHIDDINSQKTSLSKPKNANDNLLSKLVYIQDITSLYSEIMQKNRVIDFLNLFYDSRNKPISDNYSVNEQSAYIYSLTETYNSIIKGAKEIKLNYPGLNKDITELKPVSELFYHSVENYKQYIINAENFSGEQEYLSQNKTNIPKYRGTGFYRPSIPGFVTKHIYRNANGSLFLGGATVSGQGFSVAYTAYSDNAKTINWLKTTDISKLMYDDCVMALCPVSDGVMSLVSSKSVSDPNSSIQTIVKHDIKGVEKYKTTVIEKNLPLGRYLLYDDIAETMLLAFYGDKEDWFQDSTNLIFKKLTKDNQQLFRFEMTFNGKLLNIFPIDNGRFMIFGNFSNFETSEGKVSAGENMSSIFSMLIDQNGTVIKTTVYNSKKSRYGIHVTKHASNNFIIAGASGEAVKNDASPYPIDTEPVLILANRYGDAIYEFAKNSSID